ncbi:thioredoxin [bacterium]|nr:thioredoxin [bacterium]
MDIIDQTFESEILKSETPVLVDFWASWCVSCRMLMPVVEEFSQEFTGLVKVCRLDVDENPATTERFAIHSIPSLLFFKNGRLVNQIIGTCTKSKLVAMAEEVIKK